MSRSYTTHWILRKMNGFTYYLLAIFLVSVLIWQIVTGITSVAWLWHSRITREDKPIFFWGILAVQLAILIAFLVTGKSWQIRQ